MIFSTACQDLKKVAKGAGISFIGSILGRGFYFLSQVIIIRLYGVENFGLYILSLTVLKITELFARFGLHNGGMRFVSIYYEKDKLSKLKGTIIGAVGFSFLNGLIMSILVYTFSNFIAYSIFHKPQLEILIKLSAISIPFVATMIVISLVTRGFHTTKYVTYISHLIQPILNIMFIIIFFFLGISIKGAIYAFTISHLIGIICGVFFLIKLCPSLKSGIKDSVFELRKLLTYSAPLVGIGFLHFFLSWTDTFMLGIMRSSVDVGIYRAAAQIPIFLTIILSAFNSIYAPVAASLFYKKEKTRLENIFKTTTRWVYILVLPLSLFLIFSAKEIILIYGKEFNNTGALILIILTIAEFFNCITGGVGFTLTMTGRQNLEFINSFMLVLGNVFLNLFLIPRYGAVGAAIATGISVILINLLRLLEVYWLYKIQPYSKSFFKFIVPAIVSIIVLMLSSTFLNIEFAVLKVIINISILSLIFIVYMKIVELEQEDKYVLSLIMNKLHYKTFCG